MEDVATTSEELNINVHSIVDAATINATTSITSTNAVSRLSAAVVYVGQTHPQGAALQRIHLDGTWPLRQKYPATIAAYLDPIKVLLPVAPRVTTGIRQLEVIDVRWVLGYMITTGGKVVFNTAAAPQLARLLGVASPVQWPAGDAWPMKITDVLVPSSALAAVSAASVTGSTGSTTGLRAA